MDKSYKCECGCNEFWFFITHLRCKSCYNEYKYDNQTDELWMRRFNKDGNFYPKNWEKSQKNEMTIEEWGEKTGLKKELEIHLEYGEDFVRLALVSFRQFVENQTKRN